VAGFFTPRKVPDAARPAAVLTAAGRRLDTSQARTGRASTIKATEWQRDAWAYRDTIGEIRYAMRYLADAVSQVRLVTAIAQPGGADPRPLAEAAADERGVTPAIVAQVEEALTRLTAGTFDYAPILGPLAENLEVPGECYLVGYTDEAGEERIEVRSLDEITVGDGGYKLVDGSADREGLLLPDDGFVARMWNPHPRQRSLADSPMLALLGPCEELLLSGRMERAALRSRFATAGMLLLPDSLDFASSTTPLVDADGTSTDGIMATLLAAITASIQDEGDASAVVPIVMRGGAEAIAAARHLTFDRPVDASLVERGDRALRRIAQGLDVPPEIVLGMSDVNHWTAWQIDASTIRNHVGGLLRRMVDALTGAYLRPMLIEGYGMDPVLAKRIVLWYDLSPLATRPDRAQDAKDGHAAGVLSDRALVEALQFDPLNDMPDDAELGRRMALNRGITDAGLTRALITVLLPHLPHLPLDQIDVSAPVDAVPGEVVDPATPAPADPPAEDAPATPGPTTGLPASAAVDRARLHTRASQRLSRIDRDLRGQLTGAADAAITRAVERAAARVRSQANRDPSVRASLVAAGRPTRALVAALDLEVDALFDGAFDHLADQWASWTTAARAEALTTAAGMAGVHLDVAAATSAALSADADDAWAWLQAALMASATDRLFDADEEDGVSADAEDAGEDPTAEGRTRSLIRGALAIAGGLAASSAGVRSDGTAAQPGERLGGVATGGTLHGFLTDNGVDDVGYEWVYGVSRNPFEPHRDLDGVVFHDFDSAALRNPGGWPGPTLAPGDHKGCNCDAQPVYGDHLTSSDITAAGDETYDSGYLDFLRDMARDDLASGRTDTTPVRTLMEAERLANLRPSQPATPTPITDAVRGGRS